MLAGPGGSGMTTLARQTSDYARADLDWYVEPRWCVQALAEAEGFRGSIWDPACGCGTIPEVFDALGHRVIASDIADRGYGRAALHDFLGPDVGLVADNIVSNPPFGGGHTLMAFAERAIGLAGSKVAFIAQARFLFGDKRAAWFERHRPALIYTLSPRPSMPPGAKLFSGELTASGGTQDYVWIVWERGHTGPTEWRRLRRAGK